MFSKHTPNFLKLKAVNFMCLRQGAVALWSSAYTLDRKIEGSNLAANFSFERTTMTREERGDEFGDENETK